MTDASENLDLIWGAKSIARALGVTERAAYHMLERREIPARQVGQRWVASRKALEQFFGEVAA